MYNEAQIRERLRFAVPERWQDILEFKEIQDRHAHELYLYANEYYRYVDSRSPLTADAEKIVKWEVMYGITPDPNKALSERQSVVTAKMRGVGTVTEALVKFTAESFEFGQVDVDVADGVVTITFTSELGVPPDLSDIEKALRDLIPAHLGVEFEFMFNTYNMIATAGVTYDDITNSGLTYDELLTADLGVI